MSKACEIDFANVEVVYIICSKCKNETAAMMTSSKPPDFQQYSICAICGTHDRFLALPVQELHAALRLLKFDDGTKVVIPHQTFQQGPCTVDFYADTREIDVVCKRGHRTAVSLFDSPSVKFQVNCGHCPGEMRFPETLKDGLKALRSAHEHLTDGRVMIRHEPLA